MIDALLKELQPLVAAETERASKQHGEKYASAHEAESVLREEIEELAEESVQTQIELTSMQKTLHKQHTLENYLQVKFYALNAAAEAIQVAAVCEKISRGFEK